MSDAAWHPWQPLPPLPLPPPRSPAVFAEWLDGGQAFRWHRVPDQPAPTFEGGWSTHHVRLRLAPALEFSTPAHLTPAALTATATAVHAYLAGPPADPDALPWRSDPHLASCLAAFPGLHILRQPFGETLLGFVCSATKQIPQIKQMLAALATRHGRALTPATAHAPAWHALPTWAELAAVPEPALRACALGFRARHIAGIAAFLAQNPDWLETTEHAPYPEAKARLIELPGVGEKVADCVLLFGAGRLEAFPVDTWIIKAMARRYALNDWSTPQVAHFGRIHFGPQAGLAQQFLFARERAASRPHFASLQNPQPSDRP